MLEIETQRLQCNFRHLQRYVWVFRRWV